MNLSEEQIEILIMVKMMKYEIRNMNYAKLNNMFKWNILRLPDVVGEQNNP